MCYRAYTAVDTQDDILEKVIGGLLIIMFFMVLLDPSSWIKTNIEHAKAKNPILRFIIFLGIGFYGGFIQIGVGFFMLAGLVLGCGFDLLKANALKVFLILIYTSIALIIFSNHGLINWQIGFILSCGNMAGAWIGARLSVKMGSTLHSLHTPHFTDSCRTKIMGSILIYDLKNVDRISNTIGFKPLKKNSTAITITINPIKRIITLFPVSPNNLIIRDELLKIQYTKEITTTTAKTIINFISQPAALCHKTMALVIVPGPHNIGIAKGVTEISFT